MNTMSFDESGDHGEFYHFDYVRSYLDRPTFFLSGLDLRIFSMMGDRVAVSILKALYPDRQVDETKLRKILAAVCASLEYPNDIEHASDRKPAVSLCLLESLMSRAQSPEEHDMIQSAMESVRRHTAVSTPSEE